MATKQTSKSLCKKLSALRATLSDEEQALLDMLLQTQAGLASRDAGKGGREAGESDPASSQQTGKFQQTNGRIRVRFDMDREIYFVE